MRSRQFIQALLRQMVPAHCIICSHPVPSAGVCRICLPSARRPSAAQCLCCQAILTDAATTVCSLCQELPLAVSCLRSLWSYDPVSRDFIRALKYRPSLGLMSVAAQILAQHWTAFSFPQPFSALVPIPSSMSRLRKRGIWHTEKIALLLQQFVPEIAGLPVLPLLALEPGRKAQTDLLTPSQRMKNMRQAFELQASQSLAGARLLLLDDVTTTGASLASAANTLQKAGALHVSALVLARSPSFDSHRYAVNRIFPSLISACQAPVLVSQRIKN